MEDEKVKVSLNGQDKEMTKEELKEEEKKGKILKETSDGKVHILERMRG